MSFLEMTDEQREAAFGLLRAALSAKGFQQTRDIMHLNTRSQSSPTTTSTSTASGSTTSR